MITPRSTAPHHGPNSAPTADDSELLAEPLDPDDPPLELLLDVVGFAALATPNSTSAGDAVGATGLAGCAGAGLVPGIAPWAEPAPAQLCDAG